jgi:arylsulfatase A-like enzyme
MTGSERRPNFLLILTDQFHPGCLGYAGHPAVRTPNIDRLAAAGVRFDRAYTPQPLCMPARASLFTGRTPRGHGVRMNGIPLDPAVPTFTQALLDAGYRTHSCGKIHLSCNKPGGSKDAVKSRAGYPGLSASQNQERLSKISLPYYGFSGVDLCDGHAITSWGHYIEWLRREHPDEAPLFLDAVALEEPGPAFHLYNRKSFKWALPAALHPMTWIADRTIDFLSDAASRPEDPFFLVCSIQEPHSPFAPPKEYAYNFDPSEVPPAVGREGELDDLPPHFRAMREGNVVTSGNPAQPMNLTDPHRDECAAHYFSLIEMLDDQVGRVLKQLDESGLRENTVVMFLADHGEALGDHGMWGKGPYHFDSVIRVPFLISWPGQFSEGIVHQGLVNLLDVGPTVLDLAGVPIPEGPVCDPPEAPGAPPPWPGHSLVPVLRGEDSTGADRTLVEMDEDYLGFKMRTLVTRQHRITCYSGQSYGELFDLENDPQELHNLWNSPAHCALRDELRIELLDEIMRTDISLPRQIQRA